MILHHNECSQYNMNHIQWTLKNSKLLYFDIKRAYNKLFFNIKRGHRQIKTSSDELTTDSLIIDSFKIIDMLGTGNTGNVYKVELNTIPNLQYALHPWRFKMPIF